MTNHAHGSPYVLRQGLSLLKGGIVSLDQINQAIGRRLDHLDTWHRGGQGIHDGTTGQHELGCRAFLVNLRGNKQAEWAGLGMIRNPDNVRYENASWNLPFYMLVLRIREREHADQYRQTYRDVKNYFCLFRLYYDYNCNKVSRSFVQRRQSPA